jgi:hypothetical protein
MSASDSENFPEVSNKKGVSTWETFRPRLEKQAKSIDTFNH